MSSIFDWSLTAANNGNSDSSINWLEGQLPSTVNNSAREMMTRVAQLLKDIGGTVTAGGTANAITVTANSPFSSYATGQIVGFKASATNSAATTLNVNGIGAKAIRKNISAFDAALAGGEILDDGLYICIYDAALNGAAGGWLLTNPAAGINPFATLASAATTDLGTIGSENITVTGTTTITSFGTANSGTFRRLVFSGILTLTHNATSLILPQGGNVVTAVGDILEAVSLGSGNWRVTSYTRIGANGLVSGVVQTASTAAVDFTSIPSWAKRVTISFYDISTSGTTGIGVQIGPSGGPETTGYASSASTLVLSTTQFLLAGTTVAAGVYQGAAVLTLIGSNTWAFSSQLVRTDTAGYVGAAGSKTLAGALAQVRFKTGNGVETFDGGAVNILYE